MGGYGDVGGGGTGGAGGAVIPKRTLIQLIFFRGALAASVVVGIAALGPLVSAIGGASDHNRRGSKRLIFLHSGASLLSTGCRSIEIVLVFHFLQLLLGTLPEGVRLPVEISCRNSSHYPKGHPSAFNDI